MHILADAGDHLLQFTLVDGQRLAEALGNWSGGGDPGGQFVLEHASSGLNHVRGDRPNLLNLRVRA